MKLNTFVFYFVISIYTVIICFGDDTADKNTKKLGDVKPLTDAAVKKPPGYIIPQLNVYDKNTSKIALPTDTKGKASTPLTPENNLGKEPTTKTNQLLTDPPIQNDELKIGINKMKDTSINPLRTTSNIVEEKPVSPELPSPMPLVEVDMDGRLPSSILLVSLGAGEDEIFISNAAWLFKNNGHKVTMLLYRDGPREHKLPEGIKIITIPVDENDPLRPDGKSINGLTPEDASPREWAAGRVIWSRIGACRRLVDVEAAVADSQPSVIVSPLFLHDVCILALAHRLHLPVVGILTSRVGAWWTWAQLGVLPPLSKVPVPLTSLGKGSLWDRAANLGHHYGYMSNLRQQWQVRAMNVLPPSWNTPPLIELYKKVSRLLMAWDPIVDPYVTPLPTAIPIGGFTSIFSAEIPEDILGPIIMNRVGVVVVSAGSLEAWIGKYSLMALYQALSSTSFTVLWKVPHPHLRPNTSSESAGVNIKAKFIFKESIPLNDILSHPRHRFFISTCGETELMMAVYFGSPLLCLPITTNQMIASRELKRLGTAEMVLAEDANVEKLKEVIARLSSERSFRQRARELAEDIHDQPTVPFERFIFHVENVIRRPSSVRYKMHGSDLPLLQQTNADVYLILMVLLIFLSGVLVLVCVKLSPFMKKALKVKSD